MAETRISIFKKYHNTVIAFNNSGVVLKDRPYSHLIDLAIMAHQSGNPNLLCLFERIPDLATLQKMKLSYIEKQTFKK